MNERLRISAHAGAATKGNPRLFVTVGDVSLPIGTANVTVGESGAENIAQKLKVGEYIRYTGISSTYDIRLLATFDENKIQRVRVAVVDLGPYYTTPSRIGLDIPPATPAKRQGSYFFTEDDKEKLRTKLDELGQRVTDVYAKSQKEIVAVNDGIDYLKRQLEIQERNAWIHMLIGVIISLVMSFTDDLTGIWNIIKSVFGGQPRLK